MKFQCFLRSFECFVLRFLFFFFFDDVAWAISATTRSLGRPRVSLQACSTCNWSHVTWFLFSDFVSTCANRIFSHLDSCGLSGNLLNFNSLLMPNLTSLWATRSHDYHTYHFPADSPTRFWFCGCLIRLLALLPLRWRCSFLSNNNLTGSIPSFPGLPKLSTL